MAHLWVKGETGWLAKPLRGQDMTLWRLPGYVRTNPTLSWDRGLMDRLALHFHRNREERTWHLMTLDRGVLVNGAPTSFGCVLRDSDLIEVPDQGPMLFAAENQPRVELRIEIPRIGPIKMLFAEETPPRVETFPGPWEPAICSRCGSFIGQDAPAVECPECDAWHHQSDEEPCWLAGPTCARCDQPTELNVDFAWRPEEG